MQPTTSGNHTAAQAHGVGLGALLGRWINVWEWPQSKQRFRGRETFTSQEEAEAAARKFMRENIGCDDWADYVGAMPAKEWA